MPTPVPNYVHALDTKKGWPSPYAVDAVGVKSPASVASPLFGGRCVHFNAAGQFEPGAVGTQMPIFLIQGSDEFDVANSSPAGPQAWYAISPAGHMSGLVAVGSFELETTEYDQTATYARNDLLHSPTEAQITVGTDKSQAGLLFNHRNWPGGSAAAITQYVDAICAVVSRGAGQNQLRVNTLAFWPYFLPGANANQ